MFCRIELGDDIEVYPLSVVPPAIKSLGSCSKCQVLGVRGCVKSSILDDIWIENVFISGRYPTPYKLVL
jgi:hypothetical protein